MLLLGIDIGTSSVQVSVVDVDGAGLLSSAQLPGYEQAALLKNDLKEQSPDQWWLQILDTIALCYQKGGYNPQDITVIGIDCQMQELVLIDKDQNVLRSSLGKDGNGVQNTGYNAFENTRRGGYLPELMESPGDFTAAKLAWLKQNEPQIYSKIDKVMMPGEYIAMKLAGVINSTTSSIPHSFGHQSMAFSKNVIIISMPTVSYSR